VEVFIFSLLSSMASTKGGYLYKRSDVMNNWNKKYFVLQHNLLIVFDKEQGSPKNTYNLSDCMIRPAEGHHKFGFTVKLPNDPKKKFIRLAALDQASLKEWTDLIKEAGKAPPPTEKEEKKIPGRWDAPRHPIKTSVNNGKGNGGGNRISLEEQPEMATVDQLQQPIRQPIQQQQQQQQQPLPQQSMVSPMSSNPSFSRPPTASYADFSNVSLAGNAPSAPIVDPWASTVSPSSYTPTSSNTATSMFPSLRQLSTNQ